MQITLIAFFSHVGTTGANEKRELVPDAGKKLKRTLKTPADIPNVDECYKTFKRELTRNWTDFTATDLVKMDQSFINRDYEEFETIIRSRYPNDINGIFDWGRKFIEQCSAA